MAKTKATRPSYPPGFRHRMVELVRQGDRLDPDEAFGFVSEHQAVHRITTMGQVLGISTSGYYAWEQRSPSARATSDAALLERIRAIHAKSRRHPMGRCPSQAPAFAETATVSAPGALTPASGG